MGNKKDIAKRFFSLFCDISQKDLAIQFGVQQSVISEWKAGKRSIPWQTLMKFAEKEGIDLDWLVLGREKKVWTKPLSSEEFDAINKRIPDFKLPEFTIVPNAQRSHEPVPFTLDAKGLPVVGEAAADETQGSRAGFFPPDADARYDELTIPETTSAVRIIGDSMSPVLLHGQYALVGPEYQGALGKPKDYEIVIADVNVQDDEQAGSDARWEGVYCKRIIDAGDVWWFLSINHTGTPFSVAKTNCRVWPVIGVWFAGKGKPPEGF